MAQEKFLIDANAFMTPHLQYYPFDLAPSFWDKLEQHIKDVDTKIEKEKKITTNESANFLKIQ